MGGIYPGPSVARVSCDHLPPTSALCGGSAVQGHDDGALTWSVDVHWVHRPWVFPGVEGKSWPPPVFCPESPCMSYKEIDMAAIFAGLGDSQRKPICESRLAAASVGPGST